MAGSGVNRIKVGEIPQNLRGKALADALDRSLNSTADKGSNEQTKKSGHDKRKKK